MSPATRTNRKAEAAFVSGVLAVACGVLTLTTNSDLFLVGIVLFAFLAVVLGIVGLLQIKADPEHLRGKGLAGWGIGLPIGAFGLGFLLLPFV
jgi:hypothetical protein